MTHNDIKWQQHDVNAAQRQALFGHQSAVLWFTGFSGSGKSTVANALEQALARGDVALVLTEPALTNCTLVHPAPGYLEGVRRLTQQYGSLLCLDEAHTFQFAHGGLTGAWGLQTDFVVLGKGLGSGIAFALYGMSADIARHLERFTDSDIGPAGLATGGTLYASALAVSAARASPASAETSPVVRVGPDESSPARGKP